MALPGTILEAVQRLNSVDALAIERLEALVGLWQKYGRIMNLTADLRADALWRQVTEALCVVELIECAGRERGTWLDVGSGGGLPGLVVGCCLESSGRLLEPRLKRFEFLSLAVRQLELGHMALERGRLEAAYRGGLFAWVCSRAVFSPLEWLQRGRGLVGEGGMVVVHLPAGNSGGWRPGEDARVVGRFGCELGDVVGIRFEDVSRET